MQETDNTRKVREILAEYTEKPLYLDEDISPDTDFAGGNCEVADCFYVAINPKYSGTAAEAIFVHEVLEIVLELEGYPMIRADKYRASNIRPEDIESIKRLATFLQSVVFHAQVFKRMQTQFSLNMDEHYELEMQRKLDRFERNAGQASKKGDGYYYNRQQDILWGLDYVNYGSERYEKLMNKFSKLYPQEADYCTRLQIDIRTIGFDTPEAALKSARVIRDRLIEYGTNVRATGYLRMIWNSLSITGKK